MTPPETPLDQTSTDDALRRLQRLVDRLFTAIIAVVVVVAGLTVSLRYLEAIGDGRRQAVKLADLLSEYLVIRLRGIDGALARIAADNRRIGGPEGSEREWASAMRSAISGVSGLTTLVVLDAEGIIRHATIQQIRGLSWADRRVFQELAQGVPNTVVVDPPITLIAGNQILVPFGRALTDPRGDFIGAIVALLVPDQLRDFLGTFDLGPSGVAWVLLPSGETLFRAGDVDALGGVSAGEVPQFAAAGTLNDQGTVKGPAIAGGSDYITAYRKSAIGDLTVAVSIADTSLLGRWRNEAVAAAIFVVSAIALLYLAARRIKAAALDIVAARQMETLPEKRG